MKTEIQHFTISDEMRKKLESLTDSGNGNKKRQFTPEEDAIIKEYFPKKNKQELARILGMCENTMRERYKVLVNETV